MAILKRASAAAKGAQCVSLLQNRQACSQNAAALAAEQATLRCGKHALKPRHVPAFCSRAYGQDGHAPMSALVSHAVQKG